MNTNPVIRTDYPDPDVIRVDDIYYMISTTMHFMPGGVILRSYDLINWEIASYVFDKLDDTPQERLEQENSNYGCGMWAGSLRFNNGKFYVAFVSHGNEDSTYLFVADSITGPWEKRTIRGYYHDCSLLFDDDGRTYIVYGNNEIWLTELSDDLSGPKEGGLHRMIVKDTNDVRLGYEGSHFYKINGKYYLFLIHWYNGDDGMRTQACFMSDSLTGEFVGKDVLCDSRKVMKQGVAQGGIVDTPSGKWFAMLFQDSGAVGRMPILVPVYWEKDWPVFGIGGKIPEMIDIASSRPYYRYEQLYSSDDFLPNNEENGAANVLSPVWQWNHQPNPDLWTLVPGGGLAITTGKISTNVVHAVNTLTQRMMWPKCEAGVTVDASGCKDGDIAGLCALQGSYGYIAITCENGRYYLVKVTHASQDTGIGSHDFLPGVVEEKLRLDGPQVRLCLKAQFDNMVDKLDFYYLQENKWQKVGTSHHLEFKLDHFTGARFGLFVYSTKELGGTAVFRQFTYRL